MDSILAFRRTPPFSNFTSNRHIRIPTLASKSPKGRRSPIPIPIPYFPRALSFLEASRSSKEEERPVLSAECIARQVVLALFCLAIGFAALRGRAIAAPLVSDKKEVNSKGQEYSKYTKRLLETVSVLVKSIEEVRKGNGDVKLVEEGWKEGGESEETRRHF